MAQAQMENKNKNKIRWKNTPAQILSSDREEKP